jgi:hypothetical protein
MGHKKRGTNKDAQTKPHDLEIFPPSAKHFRGSFNASNARNAGQSGNKEMGHEGGKKNYTQRGE